MPHERHGYDENSLAEVWQSAQHRRTGDIYSWFAGFLERQRQRKSSKSRPQSQRRATALAWKLLNATRAVRRTVR
jgi:hypothetical protein